MTRVGEGASTSYARCASTFRYGLPPVLWNRTFTGPDTRGSAASPQQKLWLQKSFGSGGRRTIRQSFTTGVHFLPPSVEQSMRYATSGEGGLPDACQLEA